MQKSGLLDVIPLICISVTWGQYPVLSHSECPQGAPREPLLCGGLTTAASFVYWYGSNIFSCIKLYCQLMSSEVSVRMKCIFRGTPVEMITNRHSLQRCLKNLFVKEGNFSIRKIWHLKEILIVNMWLSVLDNNTTCQEEQSRHSVTKSINFRLR